MPKNFDPNLPLNFEFPGVHVPDTGLTLEIVPASETITPGVPGKQPGDLVISRDANRVRAVVSAGPAEKFTPESFRKAGGAAGKWLTSASANEAHLDCAAVIALAGPDALLALLEGLRLGAYRFDRYKKKENADKGPIRLLLYGLPESMKAALLQVDIVTAAVLKAREWAHEPANVINPITLADRAVSLAADLGLKCTILDEQALAELGAGAILSVGKGSHTPARLITIEYPGNPATDAKPVILVGKALTFDSGGYSLKDVTNIQGMKYDKCGGITVLAAIEAVARLKLSQPVIAVVGAAENMISGGAYRPDDILHTLSGKTVEIVTTDAEGRLVLADALTYAQRNFQARAIIDLATLTGGVVTALGRVRAGIMSNNADLTAALIASGERTFERLWQLPLDDEYLQSTKGDDADLKNSGGREGHPIMGGIFLKQFIEEGTPWAHLDIAGVADLPKDSPYSPKGATGFGVRLLIDYLRNL